MAWHIWGHVGGAIVADSAKVIRVKVVGAKVVGLCVKGVQLQGEGVGCGRWQGRRCGGSSLEVRRRPKPRLPTSLQEEVVEVGREQGGRAEQGGGRRDHGGGRGEQAAARPVS